MGEPRHASNQLSRKQITFNKVQPWVCEVCRTNPVHIFINYRDPDNPGAGPRGDADLKYPTISVKSCLDCIEVATMKLLIQSGLSKPDAITPDPRLRLTPEVILDKAKS